MSKKQDKTLSFEEIIDFMWRWKKQLIIVSIITIVLSSIFSAPTFIKPKFKSSVVFYPTTNNSISRALLPEVGQRAQDALEFGAEEEAEKALQILQSSKLRGRLIQQFDLMSHYKIDPTKGKFPMTKLDKKLDGNIKVSRTRYLSIKIDVMDENPEMAAKLATGIANLYDTIKNEISLERAQAALEIVERVHKAKEEMINGLHKQMQELGRQGVINYEEQSKAIQEALILAGGGSLRSSGGSRSSSTINDLLEQQSKLVEFGGLYLSIVDKIKLEEDKLSDITAKLDRARVDVEESMSHQFRVSDASVAEKKASPVRWLIVFVSLITTFLLSSLVFAFVEKVNRAKKK